MVAWVEDQCLSKLIHQERPQYYRKNVNQGWSLGQRGKKVYSPPLKTRCFQCKLLLFQLPSTSLFCHFQLTKIVVFSYVMLSVKDYEDRSWVVFTRSFAISTGDSGLAEQSISGRNTLREHPCIIASSSSMSATENTSNNNAEQSTDIMDVTMVFDEGEDPVILTEQAIDNGEKK